MYYYTIDHANAVCGPYTPRQLLDLWQDGAVTEDTEAAVAGDSVWQPLKVLLSLVRDDAETKTVPLEDAHFYRHVRAAMETGPPTSPVLLKLLSTALPQARHCGLTKNSGAPQSH